MKKTNLTLSYRGLSNAVDVYNDGQLVVHTYTEAKGATKQVFSLIKGPHTLRTLPVISITLLSGKAVLGIKSTKKTLEVGTLVNVAAGAEFSLTASTAAVIQVVPQRGPDYGAESEEDNKLRINL